MKNAQPIADHGPMDRMGQTLAGLLDQATPSLSHDVSERLRIARHQALAVRKPETTPTLLLQQGSSLALAGPPSEGLGLWSILGSSIPLLALVAGLVLVQAWNRDSIVSELAEIDTALLVDDLPPAAYSDAGFIQFLRQNTPAPREE
jgi:hypothetical protein